jgi:hypothetical protein
VNPGPGSALPSGTEVAIISIEMMLARCREKAAARGKRDFPRGIAFSRVLVLGFEIDSNAVVIK